MDDLKPGDMAVVVQDTELLCEPQQFDRGDWPQAIFLLLVIFALAWATSRK